MKQIPLFYFFCPFLLEIGFFFLILQPKGNYKNYEYKGYATENG